MHIDGTHYRTIWPAVDGDCVHIIDQTRLPHEFKIAELRSLEDAAHAIRAMLVRGAPLIGVTAAYGMALAMRADAGDGNLARAAQMLAAQRPTAVNLRWAIDETLHVLQPLAAQERARAAFANAARMADADAQTNQCIGRNGLDLILRAAAGKAAGAPVNVLTHCNAGWLATVDYGTALAPIFAAHDTGQAVHVWVDETRPRNQGAALTAFELAAHGVAHTLIADNAGGHLMQQGLVDLCIVGADRVTANGDVCNKIGTYLKALAALDNGVPFYVAVPRSTVDRSLPSGRQVPIEQRSPDEVLSITGRTREGDVVRVALAPDGTPARNDAFDVTPARLVTGLITEMGVIEASAAGIDALFQG